MDLSATIAAIAAALDDAPRPTLDGVIAALASTVTTISGPARVDVEKAVADLREIRKNFEFMPVSTPVDATRSLGINGPRITTETRPGVFGEDRLVDEMPVQPGAPPASPNGFSTNPVPTVQAATAPMFGGDPFPGSTDSPPGALGGQNAPQGIAMAAPKGFYRFADDVDFKAGV